MNIQEIVQDDSPFAGCLLHEEVKNGAYNPDYRYPGNGLPDIGPDPVKGFSPTTYAMELDMARENNQ